jgi:DNA-binding transcriptional regulator WhiA
MLKKKKSKVNCSKQQCMLMFLKGSFLYHGSIPQPESFGPKVFSVAHCGDNENNAQKIIINHVQQLSHLCVITLG